MTDTPRVAYWGAFPSFERASLAVPRLVRLYGGRPDEWRITRAQGERSWHVYRHHGMTPDQPAIEADQDTHRAGDYR